MYSAFFESESSPFQEMKIVHQFQKIRQSQQLIPNTLPKIIAYCPFIDNNGNKVDSIKEFEEICLNKKLVLNRKTLEGAQFLYLNLKDQIPDCLSLFCMGSD